MSDILFDPSRDVLDEIETALVRVSAEKKNLILVLGGDWCDWSRRFETFIQTTPELSQLRETYYITVRVYVGEEDDINGAFLDQLPEFDIVPHLFVFNSAGLLLCSQDTMILEEGEGYSYERIRDFLTRWSNPDLTPWDTLPTRELKRRFEQLLVAPMRRGPILAA